ncbi:DEAD/DEAH box helicase [Halogeometricum luteum]|uniref:DEAD/DEAH box helicase n=1 Tax=Halogeometricum luteum TaxID=2950537 RepID=A0ABU2FWQ1_9EURY|nr:DEAD/DEAH box helicase [Halogeometricum sp. S3BR5-2]MDS0292957.1 DEAD/DEAH box helicase [Halogeometricum sp. S3BR5-2]
MGDATAAQGMDAFTALGETVRAALSERGFTTPTEPQRRAIPPIAAGKNALVLAPTGTGKTETAMLPVLDAIVDSDPDEREGISALYITPLRALNRDMRERLDWWGEELDIEVDVRHGDTTQYQRGKQADDPPDVLVTTPETLQAMLTGKKLRKALSDVRHVVVDEVHELASAKRGAQLTIGLERLRALAGPFQRVGLSATVGSPEEVGKFLTGDRPFEVVEVDAGSKVEFTVVHPEITREDQELAGRLASEDEMASHVRVIRDVVRENESTLVFVNTRQTAEALGSRFKTLDAPIEVHHGSLSKDVRIDVEDRFKAGELDALICTSSMELGIDVGRVDHVVQYGSPREVARLLQRVGRAGHRRDQTSRGTVVTSSADDTHEALAIARKAEAGEVEPARIHHASLDTVANQIVGVVMDYGEVSARETYELITAAYPFRDLGEETFREIVRELSGNHLLWMDEEKDVLEKSGGTWQYFYANLSMIPDEETYDVYDMSSRRQIGTLDERFVVNFAEPGASFIQRGEMWRINDIDEDEAEVNVTPIEDPGGEVPSWTGSEIPVPAHVAGEVGEIRETAARQFAAGGERGAVARDFLARYPTDERTVSKSLKPTERQVEAGLPVPTADRLVIEGQGRKVVLNSPYGHRVNETLGRMLAALVGQRTGSSIGIETDAYRVKFEVPPNASVHDFTEVLETTDPDHVEGVLELALKHSESLKFTLAQVAAKFGALKRYQGNKRFGGDRLLAALEDTPVYDEAVREVFHVDLAVPETAELLRRIQDDEVALETARERTPIGIDGRSSGRDLLVPENADASVIQAVRERIRNDRVILLCLHCTDWKTTRKVRRVRDQPECPDCGATRIACLNPWDDETVKAVRAPDPDEEQERLKRRAYQSASLVQSHGHKAVVALAARGVGPQTAARVIGKLREDEDDFYRDILEQERQYARTQSFWD